MELVNEVLQRYDILGEFSLVPFGSGLIHRTWKVQHKDHRYILQQISHEVFRDPWSIAENIQKVASYLKERHPEYLFVEPVKTIEGKAMVFLDGHGYFRLFSF